MTRKTPRTDQEQAADWSAANRGLRHLVMAGAARIERAEAEGEAAAWHQVDKEWSRRASWRTRQHAQEGAGDEQHE